MSKKLTFLNNNPFWGFEPNFVINQIDTKFIITPVEYCTSLDYEKVKQDIRYYEYLLMEKLDPNDSKYFETKVKKQVLEQLEKGNVI